MMRKKCFLHPVLEKGLTWILVFIFCVSQIQFVPRAEAAAPGTSTVSAGSAPPPAATQVDSFQPDLFTGRAAKSVPIVVPPGRMGVQPDIMLSYSSAGRNGWLGVGWGLDQGYIERSTRNGVPSYDTNDTFSLLFHGMNADLVQIPDGTYRVKDEGSFLRIEAQGASGWEVRDKSGTRYLFGQTAASQIVNGSDVYRWCLDKVIDRHGNTMILSYSKDGNQVYPSSIEYTGHDPSSLAPANRVDFLLEDRPDPVTSYRVGYPVTTAKRLAAVESKALVSGSMQLASRYELSYTLSARTGRSLLSELTRFGSDGITSLPPMTFTYQSSDSPTYGVNFTPGSGNQVAWNVRVAGYDCGHNNYGYVHPYFPPPCGPPSYGPTVVVNVGSQSVSGRPVTVGSNGSISVGGAQDHQIHAWTSVFLNNAATKSFGTSGGDVASIWVEDATGFRGPFAFGSGGISFNAGWSVIHIVGYNQNQGWNMGITSAVSSMFDLMSPNAFVEPQMAADVDGDGFSDLINFEAGSGTWKVSLSQGSSFSPPETWMTGFGDGTWNPLVGDWNADGYNDVAIYKNGSWRFATSDGATFQKDAIAQYGFGSGTPISGDFNGDGAMDLGTFDEGNWSVALGDGTGFTATTSFNLFMPEGQPQLAPNDVRWRVRAASYDCGHNNYGCIYPGASGPCGQPNFQTAVIGGSANVGGANWSVGGSGTISCNGGQDRHCWATIAVYTKQAETHSFSLTGGDVACFYKQPQGGSITQYNWGGSVGGVSFPAGWSYIHIVGYNQNQGMNMGISSGLTSKFDIVSPDIIDENVSTASYQTGDFNGDGLTDVAVQKDGQLHVALSDGDSFVLQGAWSIGFGSEEYTTADFDGDGLTDIAYFNRSAGRLQVGYSTGSGFTTPSDLALTLSLTSVNDKIQLGEFNGDGLPDPAVFNPISGDTELAYSVGSSADLLTYIGNGLGGGVDIAYQPTTVLNNNFLPFIMQVVSSSTVSDGMGSSYMTTYSYEGGLYDSVSREFRGFSRVEVRDALNNVSVTAFHQDNQKKGKTSLTELRDEAGNLWSKTETSWATATPYPGLDIHFTYLDQSDDYIYNGDATFRQIRQRFSYDQYGNVTATMMDGDVAVSGDERTKTSSYLYNQTEWIIDTPSEVEILDDTGVVVAKRRNYYDGAGSFSTPPTVGNLTKKEEWLDVPSEQWLPLTFTYDTFGNIRTVTDSKNHATSNTWDTTSFTFVEQVTSPAGHTRTRTHNPRTGQVLTQTDENGVSTFTTYDQLGRSSSAGYTDPVSGQPIVLEEKFYDVGSLPSRTTSVIYTQPGQQSPLVTYAFSDGLGRVIQTRSSAEDTLRHIVGGATEYDELGRPKKQWATYLDDFSTVYVPHTAVVGLAPPDQYTYDPAGRLVSTLYSDGTTSAIGYGDDWLSTTDKNGNLVKNTIDAYGNLLQVEEFNGAEVYITTHTYDVRDNRTAVTDHAGNTTTMTFDSLNRKIALHDPDMGHWTYVYDANNNLISETNPRGITVTQSYDILDRMVQKSFSNGQAPVVYNYDEPSSSYGIGRLTSFSDGETSADTDYDFMGRIVSNSQTIDSQNYVVSRSYDLIGRVLTATYPNGDTLQYTYNPQGNVETVTMNSLAHGLKAIVNGVGYNAAGQITQMEYGNGVVSDYLYNPQTFRLEQLVSQSASGTIQNFAYDFDDVGNLTSITDAVNTSTQGFQYDDLNRLLSATGNGYGTRTYAYDAIGNMTQKAGVTMTYGEGAAGPHAVTSTSDGKTMTYDAIGNMLTKSSAEFGDQVFSYDAEGRLSGITGGATTLHLPPGWNLIGLPQLDQARPVAEVLPNLGTDYDQLTRLNSSTQLFESHAGNAGSDQFATVDPSRGYWIKVTNVQGMSIDLAGDPGVPSGQSLSSGWNLLSGPSESMSVASWMNGLLAGTDYGQVKGYDAASGQFLGVTDVEPGRAYYVEMLRNATWTPPAGAVSGAVQFVYNGEGARVKKITSEGTTVFLGDSYEVAPSGDATEYIYAGSQRIASLSSSGELLFYHGDHLGSSNVITDDSGAVVELSEYMPYGEMSRREGPVNVSQKFTGQYLDEETGLYYFNARYYDPSIGRFISPDGIVQSQNNPQALNRYAYAGNNPTVNVDPSGHFFFAAIGFLISKITIAAVIKGAIIGSLIGGASAAITGGNIGQGFLTGAISGAIFGGIGDFGLSGAKHIFAHAIGGALSGAVGSAVTGGDPLMGGLVGGFAAGAAAGLGQLGIFQASAGDGVGKIAGDLVSRAVAGGLVGGATAAAFGGDFLQGMTAGMYTASVAYAANYLMHEMMYAFDKEAYHQKVREILVEKGFTEQSAGTFTREVPHGKKWGIITAGRIDKGTVMTVKLTDTSAIEVQLSKPVHLRISVPGMKLGSTSFSAGTLHMNEATGLFFASQINFSNPNFVQHSIAKDINLLDLDFSQLNSILSR